MCNSQASYYVNRHVEQAMCHTQYDTSIVVTLQNTGVHPYFTLADSDGGYFFTARRGKFCRRVEDAKRDTSGVKRAQEGVKRSGG